MMHTTCLDSSVSLRCTPSRSLYFDDRFETNPLLISSSFGYPSCCCCCCATRCHSVYNTLPRTNTSFLCNGLRQSTLIQFSPSKRLIVSGNWRQLCDSSSSRFSSGSESDRIRKYCYKKVYGFDERRKLGNSRYGRYARWSYDDTKNEACFSDESEDVELLLDLLTEEVGLDNIGVRERKRFQKKDSSRTKTVKSGSVKRDLKCDIKENRKLSNERRTSVTVVNDHERKKQGSSCSSYYSVSSTGEYDSDNDVVNVHDEYFVKGESSGECKDDRKTDSHSIAYDEEVEENVERHQEFGKKESEILKKNAAESYFGNQEWRKKSEKRLNVESSQSQHTDRISSDRITGQYQSGMKNKNSSIQKRYSDTENKEETADFTRQNEYKNQSNVMLEASEAHNFDKRKASSSSSFETRMKNREETADFTRQNEYKKQSSVILEASKAHNFDTRTASSSSSFESRMKNREETADFTRQNEYKKQSNVILGASEDYNFDKRKASFSSSFETRMKKREEDATELSGRFVDQREEKYQRVDQLISSKESRVKSQQHSKKTDRITSQSQSRLQSVQELTSHKEENADFNRQNEYKKQSNVVLEASKSHNFDNRIASSSSSSFETRKKNWEESSTQVSNRFEDQREEMYQRVDQTTSSIDSRLESQQFSEISDTRLTNIENTSVPHAQSEIRTRKQETHIESSSSSGKRENIEDKYSSSQVATVVGPTESSKTGRKTTKASSFNVGMPRETPSSYKALKLNPETSFQETGAHIASADEQQKSAGQIVGEFVEKAKHQLSITEGESAYEDSEQHELKSSGDNGSGNFDEKDGEMGPSDEMWHESGSGPTSDEPAKRSGRSLWNVIGDVVRLRWGPSRSETHTPKSGMVSNQSTTSERWFSGHEPDESSRKDVSTPSSSKDKQDSPLPLLSSPSKSMSPIRMRRSPVVKTTSVTVETEPFTGGKSDQIDPKPLTQVPQTDASGSGKMVITEPPIPSRRKLARTDQVSKDRFDEWEEAYTIEVKQRKNDEFFMREALTEAKKAADLWEVPVGAVLVQDGKIIARGYNLVEELRDSTAHAEMVCIREASNKLHSWRLSGTTLYVTLEPCPMCAGAILQARIDTVVWGAPNKLLGADGSWISLFPDGNGRNGSDKPPAPVHPFHPNMIVRRGVLSSECADAMQQFFQLRRKKKDKKPEAEPPSPPPPSSCLPVVHHHHHHSKLVTKLHDAFSIMFCL